MAKLAFILALGLVPFIAAQAPPKCVLQCTYNNLGKCDLTDVECLCTNAQFLQNVGCCVQENCSAADQKKAKTVSEAQCSDIDTSSILTPTSCSTSGGAESSSANVSSTPKPTESSQGGSGGGDGDGEGAGSRMDIPGMAAVGVAALVGLL